jgi:hypothetical protein
VIFHKNVNKLEKYKEIENFLRDIFLAKKKKNSRVFPKIRLREKKIVKKKKQIIRGVKMHI